MTFVLEQNLSPFLPFSSRAMLVTRVDVDAQHHTGTATKPVQSTNDLCSHPFSTLHHPHAKHDQSPPDYKSKANPALRTRGQDRPPSFAIQPPPVCVQRPDVDSRLVVPNHAPRGHQTLRWTRCILGDTRAHLGGNGVAAMDIVGTQNDHRSLSNER